MFHKNIIAAIKMKKGIYLAWILALTFYILAITINAESSLPIIKNEEGEKGKPTLELYQEKATQLRNLYAAEYLSIAKYCRLNKLYYYAQEHAKTALKYAPDNQEAQDALKNSIAKNDLLPDNMNQIQNEHERKISALEKKLADEHTKLGVWCKQNKLTDNAENEFKQAIELYEDHPEANKQLNRERVNGFGWVDKESAAKLRQGLSEYQGKWLPKGEVEKIRSDWNNAWEIRTKHYLVKTNCTYERGCEVAQWAEELYKTYFNTFGNVFNLEPPSEPLVIWFFKSQEEYFRVSKAPSHLRIGIFNPGDRIAHFWDAESRVKEKGKQHLTTLRDTLQHECTHQLNQLIARCYGKQTWVEEGFACYCESIRHDKNGKITIGQLGHYRFGYFTPFPLSSLINMRASDMRLNEYQQAATFIRFMLNGQGSKYKQRFYEYMKRVWIGSEDPFKTFEECFADMGGVEQIEKEFLNGWSKK